jgi:cysteine-rich repeat protein
VRVVIVVAATVLAVTCVRSTSEQCGDGSTCREGTSCLVIPEAAVPACATPDQLDACTMKDPGAGCSLDGVEGTCLGGACFPRVCGDGVTEPGERCDDGNRVSNDGCSSDCLSLEVCGDGIVDLARAEQCDVGVPGLSGDGCTSGCITEFRIWRDVTPRLPAARHGHGLTTDPTRGVLFFGGASGSGYPATKVASFADTWRWDRSTFLELRSPTVPPRRTRFAIAFDSRRKRVVMFGGFDASGNLLGDTWEWNGVTWTEKTVAGSPSPRAGASIACSPTRCVMFGGVTGSAASPAYSDETWAWDGDQWSPISVATRPDARAEAAMAYDLSRDVVMMFGGVGSGSDTRTWDLAGDWSVGGGSAILPASGPDAPPSAAYDEANGFVVLVITPSTSASQTWLRNGGNWSFANVTGSTPTRIAWDPTCGCVVGLGNSAGATMELQRNQITPGAFIWASGVRITPGGGVSGLAGAYDSRRGVTVVVDASNRTWEWNGIGWRHVKLSPADSLLASEDPAIAYDAACGTTISFGGRQGGLPPSNKTHSYDGTGWTEETPTTIPPGRYRHAMTYDARRGVIVMFGGRAGTSLLDDTWEWTGPCNAKTWERTAAGPSARELAALAFDERRGVTVLFGGSSSTGMALDETWEWDGTSWVMMPAAMPWIPARTDHGMAYDPRRARVVVFGGLSAPDRVNNAWEWDGTTWTEIFPIVVPTARSGLALVGDVTGALVAFGGVTTGVSGAVVAPDHHRLQFEQTAFVETCLREDLDLDRDGRFGCDDPDCAMRCAPLCPIGMSCMGPRCGDGTCDPVEDYLICDADCDPPP